MPALNYPRIAVQPDDPDLVWFSDARISWQSVYRASVRHYHILLWRHTFFANGCTRNPQPYAGHDDAHFHGDYRRLCVQPAGGVHLPDEWFLLGDGNAH